MESTIYQKTSHAFGYTLLHKISINKANRLFTSVFNVSLFSIKRDTIHLGRDTHVANRNECVEEQTGCTNLKYSLFRHFLLAL